MTKDLYKDGKIMIVDDERTNVLIAERYLHLQGFENTLSTTDPSQALEMLRTDLPDVLLLDIMMPEISGLDILRWIRNESKRTQVIVLTASMESDTQREALALGAADYRYKPVDFTELLLRVRHSLMVSCYLRRLAQQVEADAGPAVAVPLTTSEIILRLSQSAEFLDGNAGGHVRRVGRYARLTGEQFGWDAAELELLEQAVQLHDIGKIGISDSILLKPGRVLGEEFSMIRAHGGFGNQTLGRLPETESQVVRNHTRLGEKLLSQSETPLFQTARQIALTHHERWDGGGYPQGLAGAQIPLAGRIAAVADGFDMLRSEGPGKSPCSLDRCRDILDRERGQQFDPQCVDAFFDCWDDVLSDET
ncbi:HD domain-containing phosphohydrolase [Lignipirellula cremea]|uniref:Cyclic di-GMP phosphodiesterase response regulator RpfG n=1 Tax=Lignipirellula cremea TaxID=2528010 RepID=A0A518DX70_9BACT|nr:HD domain-containing phosphohydrolase [Lignipirellula cremea]QDU96420.1 Cyclic di-GMP phosphodiesterase response regulator RpfG [Lignipirellula cremea]